MYGSSGIRHYREISVKTMTPERMIVMLYEGIFRNLETARRAIARKDLALRTAAVNKAQAIICELSKSLDHDCGATFTHDLVSLYNYMYNENVELLLDSDTRHIDNVRRVLQPLYESWRALPGAEPESAAPNGGAETVAPANGPEPASGSEMDGAQRDQRTTERDAAHRTRSLSLAV